MLDRLPVFIDPLSFAEKGRELTGVVEIQTLPRLADVLLDDSGVVNVSFSFSKDGRLPVVEGEIKTCLVVTCQSCLEPLELPVNQSFKLGLVISVEQADMLSSEFDACFFEEELELNKLVEDELLLALPDFPRHEHQCLKTEKAAIENSNNDELQSNSNNPFSVLAKLKNSGDK